MSELSNRLDMNIVIVGHVDHGKSTIIGRLLYDTNFLPKGKLDKVKEICKRNSKPFEYAFLLDALKDEQLQGITIDSARCFFKTKKRNYIIIDAPGHIEFLKNMVTGASRAEAALLVIDANEGVKENSTRHGYLLSMLGIKQVSVLVNKMDLVNYSKGVFEKIVFEYSKFLKKIDVKPASFIPVSGFYGENVAFSSKDFMPWYEGRTLLEELDDFENEKQLEDKPFRMWVQGIYKFTRHGDDRRIIVGTVDAGMLSVGDEIVFFPSGKKSRVRSIEVFNEKPKKNIRAGYASGFTLTDQIYITRGEMVVKANELQPQITSKIKVNLFWLGKKDLNMEKRYNFKIGTSKVGMKVEKIIRVLNASNLDNSEKDIVERHEVAKCILKLDKAVAFDLAKDNATTSRFVIVDEYEISGGGIINEAIGDEQEWVRDKVLRRNIKWEKSQISYEERAEKYNQRAILLLITGAKNTGKKRTAKALEKKLFNEGKMIYFMGIGNILYGVDADIKVTDSQENRDEQLRRMAEVANLMLDAGMIIIVTARNITQNEVDFIKTIIPQNRIKVVLMGNDLFTDITYDIQIKDFRDENATARKIKGFLRNTGAIFKPNINNS